MEHIREKYSKQAATYGNVIVQTRLLNTALLGAVRKLRAKQLKEIVLNFGSLQEEVDLLKRVLKNIDIVVSAVDPLLFDLSWNNFMELRDELSLAKYLISLISQFENENSEEYELIKKVIDSGTTSFLELKKVTEEIIKNKPRFTLDLRYKGQSY